MRADRNTHNTARARRQNQRDYAGRLSPPDLPEQEDEQQVGETGDDFQPILIDSPGSYAIEHGQVVVVDTTAGDVELRIPDTIGSDDNGKIIQVKTYGPENSVTLSSARMIDRSPADAFEILGPQGGIELVASSDLNMYLRVTASPGLVRLDKDGDVSVQGATEAPVEDWIVGLDNAMVDVTAAGVVTMRRNVLLEMTALFNVQQQASGNRTGQANLFVQRDEGGGWVTLTRTQAFAYVDIDFGSQGSIVFLVPAAQGDRFRIVATDESDSPQSNPVIVALGTQWHLTERA